MGGFFRQDNFSQLVLRIGYAVGLEYIAQRVADVLRKFLDGSLNGAVWRTLVHEDWGRSSKSAEKDLADVYAQLEILQKHNSAVFPLPALEAMSIIVSGSNPLKPDRKTLVAEAVTYILSIKIIEADGDVFLNALSSGFSAPLLGRQLQSMIRHKRRVVAPLFPQAASIRRLSEAINIRHQSSAEGGASRGNRRLTYAEKSRVLHRRGSDAGPPAWTEEIVPLSDDYLGKLIVTRRGWAEDCGLFVRGVGLTQAGASLLASCMHLGLRCEDERSAFFAVWPYAHQMRRLNLDPDALSLRALTRWDISGAVACGRHCATEAVHEDEIRLQLLHLLSVILDRYQKTSPRGVLRHDLPIFIADPVLAWWYAQAGLTAPDLRTFVRSELKRSDRGVDLVTIRGTEGGLRLIGRGRSSASA